MDELNFSIEDDVELDYEAEEAARRAQQEHDDVLASEEPEDDHLAVEEAALEQVESANLSAELEAKRRSRKRKSSPPKWNRGFIDDDDEVVPGQDLLSRKKFVPRPGLLPGNFFPDEMDPEFSLEGVIDDHPPLQRSEVGELFDSLNVAISDESIPFNTIYVVGVEGMDHYNIEKVFADYHPHITLFVETESCIVQFRTSRIATKLLVGMSKRMERVRKPKKIEEGEINDSDEEREGELKEENGETVRLVTDLYTPANLDAVTEVEVDVGKYKVPRGLWRVITKHVPANRLLLARFARQSEIQQASRNLANTEYRSERTNSIKSRSRLRAGINVFDNTGKELPWNFEHDTRIFNDPQLKSQGDSDDEEATSAKRKRTEEPSEQMVRIGDQVVRSRGRGSKRALQLQFSSDEEEESDDAEPAMESAASASPKVASGAPSKASDLFRQSVLNPK